MRYFIAYVGMLVWAMWLGALISLFIFVPTLFHNDRDIALQAAPQLFHVFENIQPVLAGIALILAVGAFLQTKSWWTLITMVLLLIAAAFAAVSRIAITPRMDALVAQGQSGSPAFMQLHGMSMGIYSANILWLLIVGLLLPHLISHAIRSTRQPIAASI